MDLSDILLAVFNLIIIVLVFLNEIYKGWVTWKSCEVKEETGERSEDQPKSPPNCEVKVGDDISLVQLGGRNQHQPKVPPNFMKDTFEPVTQTKCFFRWHVAFMIAFLVLGGVTFGFTSESLQEKAKVVTGTTVNIEGAALAKVRDQSSDDWKVWDPTNIAEPAMENTIFFVTTRRVMTENQTLRDDCFPSDVRCSNDTDCENKKGKKVSYVRDSGVYTGSCSNGNCSVLAWCPLEYDTNDPEAHVETLNSPLDFDILIKSHLRVSYDDRSFIRNSAPKYDDTKAKRCHYDEDKDTECPRFSMPYVVDEVTGKSAEVYKNLINNGGVISIQLVWKCDTLDHCTLKYKFKRLDNENSAFETPYSYTDSEYKYGTDERTLIRSTGIIFIVQIDASGRRFSALTFLVFAASALGLIMSSKTVVEFCYLVYLKNDKSCCHLLLVLFLIGDLITFCISIAAVILFFLQKEP